jgi:copper chaperone CopZ
MDCPGCHGGLEKLVRKIPAVQQVEANWKEKQLVVTVKPEGKLNDEEIYDAIQRANFTVGKRIK